MAGVVVPGAHVLESAHVVSRGEALRDVARGRTEEAMRHACRALLRELAGGVHEAEVLAAVGIDGEVRILPLAALRDEMLAAGDALAQTLATAAVAAELAASAPPPELEEDDDELSADEALDTEHSPDHVTSIATALDPAMDVTLEWPSPRVDAEVRRPQRRRGRRGGRRNRPGGASGTQGTREGGEGGEGGDAPQGDQ